ncbi:beta-ketoacyl-ACP synthase II [Pullulanibacillus sp. KACC 23026]|uniref:beta-ketoacyl-ACP synthase II n=1 Tax=Pullulanibacillus sp. KACC 23026 TaxID=3028315 RepID=UPI0023B08121|nr:beta-ketoacyl-ACP synthase II [Pullulanibacillus sp. KACC 23026]WEG12352.1 beta-ketoacyl-ACP synthase II [Pullulanibacillus sp. KACC 23026]
MPKERIVITGMGAVTPLGIGVSTYWEQLIRGKSGIGPIKRYEAEDWPIHLAGEVPNFDPTAFLPKKLIRTTDIFMQYALIAAAEALKDRLKDINLERVGVVLGTALGGIQSMSSSQEQLSSQGNFRLSPHTVPKMLGNIGASQVAITHGLKGPSLTVGTACSAGADAVGIASMLLNSGQADLVIAVGAESILTGLMVGGLSSAKALSLETDPEMASRPFDKERNGFVIGEGAGAVLLETLSSAEKRGVPIEAELLGYANRNDAHHVTAPEPNGEGEMACIRQALNSAGLALDQIDYINAHGTSTKLGDQVETAALKAVFGEAQAKKLAVSSTKGATGHLMGAGGVTELITCIKAIQDQVVPPTLNYRNPDPDCDLDYVPNEARSVKVNIAMSNSFGFGGQNASLIVGRFNKNAGN